MSKALTHNNAARLKSSPLRRFLKQGPGSVVFRSEAYRRLLLFKHYVSSQYLVRAVPNKFEDVQTFCMFVGHNKSGTSMIGALLDAHPEVILSDEADALEFVRAGFGRDQIFHILLRRSRKEFQKGRVTARRLQPYSYLVPGAWQGRYRTLRVIGDSTAGSSTRMIGAEPDILKRVQSVMHGVDVKLIQTIRNPYDPISVMMVRGKRSFENAIGIYFSYCKTLAQLRDRLSEEQLFAVRYEDFVMNGETRLAEICRFLGLQAEPDYLKACAGILNSAPVSSRQMVKWDSKHIDVVAREIERFDFLRGYSFEA